MSKITAPDFIVVDSEGGAGKIILLQAKQRRWKLQLWNREGITQPELYKFFKQLRRQANITKARIVFFGGEYDWVNFAKILLGRHWRYYGLQNLDSENGLWGKMGDTGMRFNARIRANQAEFYFGKYHEGGYTPKKKKKRKSNFETKLPLTFDDCRKFWQGSFEDVINELNIGTATERKMVAEGKAQRGNILELPKAQIIRYQNIELKLLEQLLIKLKKDCAKAELPLTQFTGPSRIAKNLMSANKINSLMVRGVEETYKADLLEAVDGSYFAGINRLCWVGEFDAHHYDLRSAYSYALKLLPDGLGSWQKNKGNSAWELCEVFWKAKQKDEFIPLLPWRNDKEIVKYPKQGYGWYWKWEIEEMVNGGRIDAEIFDRWVYTPKNAEQRPFEFIDKYFEKRQEFPESSKIIKSVLNSIYGCLMETKYPEKDWPVYRWLPWASMVTSLIRTRMQGAVNSLSDPRNVIAMTIDGLYLTEKLIENVGEELGQFSYKGAAPGLFMARNFYIWKDKIAASGHHHKWVKDHRDEIEEKARLYLQHPTQLVSENLKMPYKQSIFYNGSYARAYKDELCFAVGNFREIDRSLRFYRGNRIGKWGQIFLDGVEGTMSGKHIDDFRGREQRRLEELGNIERLAEFMLEG